MHVEIVDPNLEITEADDPIFGDIEYQYQSEIIAFLRDGRKILIPDVDPETWRKLVQSADFNDELRELIKSRQSRFVR